MANSMVHWNGNQLCVIDCETTGLDPHYHDLIQIAIIALDSDIRPREEVLPFYINLIPEHPHRASPEAMAINKLKFTEIAKSGHDQEKAKDLLRDWVEKLGLPSTKYGNRKKILPLGQNFGFDKGFIQSWLGLEMYNELFFYDHRDTKRTAVYLNDRAAMHAETVPFSKTSLRWLATKLNVRNEHAHDALSDCVATAEVYRKLLLQGLLS